MKSLLHRMESKHCTSLFCEGSNAARDLYDAPVIVLLDLKLAKVDGFEVLKKVKTDERARGHHDIHFRRAGYYELL